MSVIVPGRNIVLIGMPGCGKTSIGTHLAALLDRPFIDTDQMVETDNNVTIAEIFEREGERHFRALEAEAVRGVSSLRGQVIATGGGALIDPKNATALRGTGDLVWLDATLEELQRNLSAESGGRPLLDPYDLSTSLRTLAEQRFPLYAAAASVRIVTEGRHPQVLADEVASWAHTRPGLLAREEQFQ